MNMDIVKVAQLARLNLKQEEKAKLEKDLAHILDYVAQMNQLKTQDVEPTSHVLNLENVYRKDQIKSWPVRDELLRHAPAVEGKFFKVPKVIAEE